MWIFSVVVGKEWMENFPFVPTHHSMLGLEFKISNSIVPYRSSTTDSSLPKKVLSLFPSSALDRVLCNVLIFRYYSKIKEINVTDYIESFK